MRQQKAIRRIPGMIRIKRLNVKSVTIIIYLIMIAVVTNSSYASGLQLWENEYGGSYYLPTDIISNSANPEKALTAESLSGTIKGIEYMYSVYSEYPQPEMTPLRMGKVKEALDATFGLDVDTNELLKIAELGDAKHIAWPVWHLGQFNNEGIVFWMTFMVDGTKLMIMGSIEDGVTEALAIEDYYSIEEYEMIAKTIFNMPYEEQAQDDYRPVKFQYVSTGFGFPDPLCDYDYSGYVISFIDDGREALCRSVAREFIRNDNNPPTEVLDTIEFSVEYQPADNLPPLVDLGPDQVVDANEIVYFNGTCIDPEEVGIIACEFDYGDNQYGTEGCNEEVQHIYTEPGIYTAVLRAYDGEFWGQDECTITVN
jgi:hypothetical protein